MKDKRIWFISTGVLLLLVGAFFMLKPMMQNKQDIKKQETIMTAIENGEATIDVKVKGDDVGVDYYDLDAESEAEIDESIEIISSVDGIGIMQIERIDLKLPVVEGATKATLKVALGHVSESAPIGEVGNCIIAGHRKYEYGLMFNRLDEVEVGDVINYTSVKGIPLNYKVYATTVIIPNDNSLFDYEYGQKKLTLLTCTPIKKATHRLLIQANLIE
jgi:sortase A